MKRYLLSLLLLLTLLPLATMATGLELAPSPTDASTQEEAPSSDPVPPITEALPPDLPPDASESDQLKRMEVLLMYICGIAIFWTFVSCGKLMYRFFNMFF